MHFTFAQLRPNLPVLAPFSADAPLNVSADTSTFDNARQTWTGRGNVRIQNDEHELSADRVTVNHATGDVSARGNIVLIRPGMGEWRGEAFDYNHVTRAGLVGPSEVHVQGATLLAGEIAATTNNILTARDTRFTTCANEPGHWHYHVTASRVTLDTDRNTASFHNATVWFLGVPVGWFPYWYRDPDASILRLTPGYSSRWGAFLLGTRLYTLHHDEERDLSGRLHLDYRTSRGPAIGNDLLWRHPGLGEGQLSLYALRDFAPPDYGAFDPARGYDPVTQNRHRAVFQNILAPTENDRLVVRLETHSDLLFLNDFFRPDYRSYFQPHNFAAYTRRHETWAAGLTLSGPLNTFYDATARLPEAWLSLPATPLGLGFYYENDSRAGLLHFYPSRQNRDLGLDPYDALRLDTYHRVTRPFTLEPFPVALTPYAAFRATRYSQPAQSRLLPELGADLSTKFYGTLDFDDVKLFHILQPYAGYTYVPAAKNFDPEGLRGFDRYDAPLEWRDHFGFDNAPPSAQWHGFRVGLRHLFQTGEPGKRRTVLDENLYAAYVLDSEDLSQGWGLLGTRSRCMPFPNLAVNLNADYDPKESALRYLDVSAEGAAGRYTLQGGWLRRNDPLFNESYHGENSAGILYARLNQSVGRAWGWGLEGRYNTDQSHFDEVGATVTHRVDCMSFQLRAAYAPPLVSRDDIRQGSDVRVSLLIRLNPGEMVE
ncbi:MAG: LPS assembly protein LptD [Kiritimatiellaeota bacterium]|nr:LPS assembly protein LptD [Kiritimatiellota bacterium]